MDLLQIKRYYNNLDDDNGEYIIEVIYIYHGWTCSKIVDSCWDVLRSFTYGCSQN